jgi:hypothetical protein
MVIGVLLAMTYSATHDGLTGNLVIDHHMMHGRAQEVRKITLNTKRGSAGLGVVGNGCSDMNSGEV